MKLLFITSNRVGDAVLSTGVLAQLIAHDPGLQVTVVCGPYAAGLFRAVPGLERLIVLKKKKFDRHWLDLWMECIGTRWDVIVDLRNSFAARLLRSKKYAHRNRSSGAHKVVENARILDLLQSVRKPEPPAPQIWLDAEAEHAAAQILPSDRPLIAFGPAANWPPKQWPIENFIALARKLTAEGGPFSGAPVVVIAGENEHAIVSPLLDALPACVPVIGQDLLTVAACLKECALFVGNDSGLMHMAAAMKIPTLGLFGPGHEEIYGPWGPYCASVRTPEKREELLSRLSSLNAIVPNLMENLSVDMVFIGACGLIKKQSDSQ